MPDPIQGPPPISGSGYVVDAENVAEMARLTRQARMLSEHLASIPNRLHLHHVLISSTLGVVLENGLWRWPSAFWGVRSPASISATS